MNKKCPHQNSKPLTFPIPTKVTSLSKYLQLKVFDCTYMNIHAFKFHNENSNNDFLPQRTHQLTQYATSQSWSTTQIFANQLKFVRIFRNDNRTCPVPNPKIKSHRNMWKIWFPNIFSFKFSHSPNIFYTGSVDLTKRYDIMLTSYTLFSLSSVGIIFT